jgi:hypothetical protein
VCCSRLAATLVETIPDNPHLVQVYRETNFAPRRRTLLAALRRAQAESALSSETDVEVIADILARALLFGCCLGLGQTKQLKMSPPT